MELHERKEKKGKFIELRGIHEFSLDNCSKRLNVSKVTLLKWEKELKSNIDFFKRSELNSLIDTYKLSLRARLTRYKELNNALSKEIKSRTFEELPTEKLIKLYLDSLSHTDNLLTKNNLNLSNPFSYDIYL